MTPELNIRFLQAYNAFMRLFLISLLFFANHAFAEPNYLSLNCLKNYKELLSPVTDRSFIMPTVNIANLQEVKIYKGGLPKACGDSLGIKGELSIVTSQNTLFVFGLFLENPKPLFVKYIASKNLLSVELGIRRYKSAGSHFISNIDNNLPLSYILNIVDENHVIETLSYRHPDLAKYE